MLLALRVSGLSVGNAGDTYKVYAYFDNIAGVTVRGKVTLAGVTIGKVTAVDLDRDSFAFVVTWIAVYQGYDCEPTSEGISRATTRTVVYASLAVLGLDFILTALMFGDF